MDSHEFLERVRIIILKMFREVPENTEEQYNKIRRTIQEQNEKFNKGKENIKKNQTENLKLKNTMTEQNNLIKIFKSTNDQAE